MERFLSLVNLKDEDGDTNKNKGREGKGGTTSTPSMAKNVTMQDKEKSAMTTLGKKIRIRGPPPCWVVVSAHRSKCLLRYFQCDDVESDKLMSFKCRIYTVTKI